MQAVGIMVNGRRLSTIFRYVFDLDLSALYPHIILSTNIDTETTLCSMRIERQGYTEEVDNGDTKVTVPINFAPLFMDTMSSRDTIKIMEKWCGMPSLEHILDDLEKLGIN
jgi:DNA polymerase elongation subunit (family B)